jgi:hypothetical protein
MTRITTSAEAELGLNGGSYAAVSRQDIICIFDRAAFADRHCESLGQTTQRYAHLAPDAHDKVLQSWKRRHDAPVTHDSKKAHPS